MTRARSKKRKPSPAKVTATSREFTRPTPSSLYRSPEAPLSADDLAALDAMARKIHTFSPERVWVLGEFLSAEYGVLFVFEDGAISESEIESLRSQLRMESLKDIKLNVPETQFKAIVKDTIDYIETGFKEYGVPFMWRVFEELVRHEGRGASLSGNTNVLSLEKLSSLYPSLKRYRTNYQTEVEAHNASSAQLKKRSSAPDGDVVVTDGTTPMEGPLRKERPHTRPKKRDRTGYSQPGRAGKVPLSGWVEPELREAFKVLAKRAGLTKEELMTYLVENVLETAQKDPSLVDQIAKNVERQKAITKRILRAASASLIKKATP
jgi:hypothetical protein